MNRFSAVNTCPFSREEAKKPLPVNRSGGDDMKILADIFDIDIIFSLVILSFYLIMVTSVVL